MEIMGKYVNLWKVMDGIFMKNYHMELLGKIVIEINMENYFMD